MVPAVRVPLLVLSFASVATAVLGLVPEFYHRWWWWDLLVHSLAAGLLAVWVQRVGVPRGWRWPALVVPMLAWEWLELSVRWFLSPDRHDVLLDLTVNVLAFWAVLAALDRLDGADAAGAPSEAAN